MKFKFGDVIENGYASEDNPRKKGIFIKRTNKYIYLTDGKGNLWTTYSDHNKLTKIGNVVSGKI